MGDTAQAKRRVARKADKSDLELLIKRNQIHLAFFAYAAARRDLVVEQWAVTAYHFKKRFNIGDEYTIETLVRSCSDEIAIFIQRGL